MPIKKDFRLEDVTSFPCGWLGPVGRSGAHVDLGNLPSEA